MYIPTCTENFNQCLEITHSDIKTYYMCPIASEESVEVTFGSYKERQAHYAQMKRPGHFFWIALSPCRKAWMPYINFEHTYLIAFAFYTVPCLGIAWNIRQLEASDSFDIPNEIVESWHQAIKTRSRAGKNAVFLAFLRAGKDWSKLLGWTKMGNGLGDSHQKMNTIISNWPIPQNQDKH